MTNPPTAATAARRRAARSSHLPMDRPDPDAEYFVMKILCCPLLFLILTPAFAEESKKAQDSPSSSSETVVGIDPKLLCQQWLRSNEEERPGDEMQVFRPKTFQKFPPSRFRMQYVFVKDGSLKWLDLVSNDAHQLKDGKWKFSAEKPGIIQIIKGDVIESHRVTGLTRDVLKLRLITP